MRENTHIKSMKIIFTFSNYLQMKKNIKINTVLLVFLFLYSTIFSQNNGSQNIQNQILDQHNYYRQQQGVPYLTWSDELATDAQLWANKLAASEQMMHSNMQWGENIYYSAVFSNPKDVVDTWASEQKYYNGEPISAQTVHLYGHYTQIIWSSTTQIGCAYAVSVNGNYYWVCEYSPPGNYIGLKPVKNYKTNKD